MRQMFSHRLKIFVILFIVIIFGCGKDMDGDKDQKKAHPQTLSQSQKQTTAAPSAKPITPPKKEKEGQSSSSVERKKNSKKSDISTVAEPKSLEHKNTSTPNFASEKAVVISNIKKDGTTFQKKIKIQHPVRFEKQPDSQKFTPPPLKKIPPQQTVATWDYKIKSSATDASIIWKVKTKDGKLKYIKYLAKKRSCTAYTHGYVCGLGSEIADGSSHKIARDLQEDIRSTGAADEIEQVMDVETTGGSEAENIELSEPIKTSETVKNDNISNKVNLDQETEETAGSSPESAQSSDIVDLSPIESVSSDTSAMSNNGQVDEQPSPSNVSNSSSSDDSGVEDDSSEGSAESDAADFQANSNTEPETTEPVNEETPLTNNDTEIASELNSTNTDITTETETNTESESVNNNMENQTGSSSGTLATEDESSSIVTPSTQEPIPATENNNLANGDNIIVLEDGNDASDWEVYDNNPDHPTEPQVFAQHGMIVIQGNGYSNAYRMKTLPLITEHFVAQWDYKIKSDINTSLYWRIKTTEDQIKNIRYTLENKPCEALGESGYVCGLGGDMFDGQFHTIVRDLEADMASTGHNVQISEITSLLIRGDVHLDNIILKK